MGTSITAYGGKLSNATPARHPPAVRPSPARHSTVTGPAAGTPVRPRSRRTSASRGSGPSACRTENGSTCEEGRTVRRRVDRTRNGGPYEERRAVRGTARRTTAGPASGARRARPPPGAASARSSRPAAVRRPRCFPAGESALRPGARRVRQSVARARACRPCPCPSTVLVPCPCGRAIRARSGRRRVALPRPAARWARRRPGRGSRWGWCRCAGGRRR